MKLRYDVARHVLVVEGADMPPAAEAEEPKKKPARRKSRKVANKAAQAENKEAEGAE